MRNPELQLNESHGKLLVKRLGNSVCVDDLSIQEVEKGQWLIPVETLIKVFEGEICEEARREILAVLLLQYLNNASDLNLIEQLEEDGVMFEEMMWIKRDVMKRLEPFAILGEKVGINWAEES